GDRQVEDVGVRLVGDTEPEPAGLPGGGPPTLLSGDLPGPRGGRGVAAGKPPRRCLPAISTVPWSGARKPLAIPSNVDFPDPFSPTSAWISPAWQSTLTSRSALTAPNAFETSRRESTEGLAGPGVDIVLGWLVRGFAS